ncbi:T9SS type A sorting domain-containing protein [Moheibacter sediminis]|uniref:Por secretion system C-terminal sorting domain-containing protein n=1 Tax=Moheibacter sediminis TaxID=1434700 RepID=A0A1W2CF44_9FLAO|nr:T9SS type A sorting domain-containing protein [Moheibacter sediminis]SMC83877.1 Por secretion system C-terminal sorting domain-containing protein [Moheibacter sediminis]
MKKLYLFIVLLNINLFASAQSPELYRIWHLKSIEYDFGGEIIISEIEPDINPYILFYEDHSFEGFAACTEFNGNAEIITTNGDNYGNITFQNLNLPEIYCENEIFNIIQNDFEIILSETREWLIATNPQTQELELLIGEMFHTYRFTAGEMNTVENSLSQIEIYPNPAFDYIHLKNVKPNSMYKIYNLSGKIVSEGNLNVSNKITINRVPSGVYILKLDDAVLKFIKK